MAANAIKSYFLRYDECVSNDFVLSQGGRSVELLKRDIDDWRITFVDTGDEGQHRPAPARGAPVPRGRGGVPRQLLGRPEQPRPRRLRLVLPRARQDGLLPERGRAAHLPHRGGRARTTRYAGCRRWATRRCASTAASSPFAARSSTIIERGRGPRVRAVRAADRRAAAARVSIRRLLAQHGHLQGPAAPRAAARVRGPRPGRCGLRDERALSGPVVEPAGAGAAGRRSPGG